MTARPRAVLTASETESLLTILREVEAIGVRTGTWEQGKVLDEVGRIISRRGAR